MSKTISFHCGSTYSRGHNIRDDRYVSEQKHIDKNLSARNEVIRDEPVREAYQRLFGEAQKEYNARQSRADRRIEDYYSKIKADKRKKPVYECIVQIGDRNDTGNLAIQEKDVLRQYAQTWEQRNPRLKLIGAYIHADEPNGTVHLHCDFIPTAKCGRGMKLQNSFAKALEQQGYRGEKATQTAQMSWQQAEREALERLCIAHKVNAKANQSRTARPHLSKSEYIYAEQQMREELTAELEQQACELREYLEVNRAELSDKKKLDEIDAQTKSKGVFSKVRQIPEEKYQELLKTAQNASGLNKQLSEATARAEQAESRAHELQIKLSETEAELNDTSYFLEVAEGFISSKNLRREYTVTKRQFAAGAFHAESSKFQKYTAEQFEAELRRNRISFVAQTTQDGSVTYYRLPMSCKESVLDIQIKLYNEAMAHTRRLQAEFEAENYGQSFGRGRGGGLSL